MRRRGFLTGALALAACKDATVPFPTGGEAGWMDGEFLGLAPYIEPLERTLGEKYRVGWDARLIVDLSRLESTEMVLTEPEFYIRTERPDRLDISDADWTIEVSGLASGMFTLEDLLALEEDQGQALLECSGNGPTAKFGLMSSAEWAGVRLDDLFQHLQIHEDAWGVEVIGFDDHSVPSENNHSTPGASWILPLDALGDAFLATSMAGVALTGDHGRPVRLVLPNQYGCACIKWVTGLRFVDIDAPITGQMHEFASRTEQVDDTVLARDYLLPEIDHAATVIRVERWGVDGAVRFRVIGLAWGGQASAGTLSISVDGGLWPVDVQPDRPLYGWGFWEHALEPGVSGAHVFSTEIEGVRTRRLDRGYYDMGFELQS